MKKHLTWKQKLFNWFEKNDTKNKVDDLSQPQPPKKRSEMTPEDRKNNNKKLTKKLIYWGSIIGVLSIIIVPTAVVCSQKKEIYLSTNMVATFEGNNPNKVTFKEAGNSNDAGYIVEIDAKNFIGAYYGATSFSYHVYLKASNSALPIVVPVTIDQTSTGWEFVVYNQQFDNTGKDLSGQQPSPPDDATIAKAKQAFATNLLSLRANATTRPESFNWLVLIQLLFPLLMFGLIMFFIYSMMRKQTGGVDSIFGMGKSTVKATKTNVKFTDVAGIDEVRDELKELVDYVQNSNKYAAMGARSPKGVILYGPPGTGKTLIAKAVAGEANCNFFPTSGSAFEDMLVGVGAKRVRDLFNKARAVAPSIIFIDEIDSVASKRGKNDIVGGGAGVADQTINQLLAEMDGFSSDSGVIIIAATNRLDVLDDAILRPGRFDRQIQVSLPDIKGREEILKIHSRNKNISSEVSLLDVARRTPGFSGAQLENVLNEAAILAVRNKKIVIKSNDIDEAIDRVIGGPARHGRVISETDKKQIAYHEAGHALVGLHSKNTEVVQKITIIPRGDAAGYTMQTPAEHERAIQTKEDLLNQVRMTLGGRAAEEIIFGKDQITTGAANDLYKVSKIVKAMVLSLGMTSCGLTQFVPSEGNTSPMQQKMYSEQTARELDTEIEKIIQKEYEAAKQIILNNRKELDLIVETLLILETILKPQIDYIHEHLALPQEAIDAQTKINEEKAQKDNKELKASEDKDQQLTNNTNSDNSTDANVDTNSIQDTESSK